MKLFIAGCEPAANRRMPMNARASNYLTSYYHLIHKGGTSQLKSYVKEYNAMKQKTNAAFIMDSGLFTMMFGAGSHKSYTKKDLLEYTNKYISNMKQINYEDTVVEMDVHKVLGIDELQQFRNIFIKNYDLEKVMFVWHIEETIDGWKQMCRDYKYVALSIPELRIVLKGKYLKAFIQKMINIAIQINPSIKIHLLGCTSNNLLDVRGYYSSDSTSWQQPLRYGDIKNPVTMKTIHQTQLNITKLKKEFIQADNITVEKLNTEPTKFLTNEYYQVSGYLSVRLFLQMAQYINKRHNTTHDNILIFK